MEEVKTWLLSYGLNETEIKVYLCILGSPEIKVSDIQTRTGLVRTTIYYALSSLKSGGLISENTQNNIKTYRCNDPNALRYKIELEVSQQRQKLKQLDGLKSVFESIKSEKPAGQSHISRYEGIEPVKKAIEEAFRCDSKRWHILASRDNFLYHMSKKYQRYYLDERKRRGITAKTLWEPADSKPSLAIEDVFYRNPRMLPKEFQGAFNSLIILYDNTTLIIDPYSQKTAHAVHNQASTQLLRLLFDFIWQTVK